MAQRIFEAALRGRDDSRQTTRRAQDATHKEVLGVSVPPEVMAKLAGGGAPKPGGAPGGMPQSPRPGGTPMAKPQEKEGLKEIARTNIHIAMNMLEQALPVFGTESKEGGKLIDILKSLSKSFGHQEASDLVPAQIGQMNKSLTQAGGGTEVQRMLQKMQQQGGGAQPQPQAQPQPA